MGRSRGIKGPNHYFLPFRLLPNSPLICRSTSSPRKNPAKPSLTANSLVDPPMADQSSLLPMAIDGSDEDALLARSEFLTREELLARRSRRLKQLTRVYKDHYWALMEEVKSKYREYYWHYGRSPFKEDEKRGNSDEGLEEGNGKLGLGLEGEVRRCSVTGCKTKAMALTQYCHTHILSDTNQKLYIACNYPIKSTHTGPITCGKPILRSSTLRYCSTHYQIAEKLAVRALKKAGRNPSLQSGPNPKFHVLVAEYVHQIQTKRKVAQKTDIAKN